LTQKFCAEKFVKKSRTEISAKNRIAFFDAKILRGKIREAKKNARKNQAFGKNYFMRMASTM
jgi:hypothetical protein